MIKDELLTRLYDLIDDVEHANQENFDDEEIEDLVCEARIPITLSTSVRRSLREGG